MTYPLTQISSFRVQNKGSLFVAKRSSNPRFKIVVMNRNSKENLEVPLGSSFQMQIREPYLIFKGDEAEPQKIRGIWFHDGDERQSIVEVLNRVVKSLASNDNTGTLQTVPVQSSSKNQGAPTGNINRKKAAASLMAVLKIGGGGSGSEQTRKQQPEKIKSLPKVEEPSIENMVLDKKSLQLSLMSLLQEDKFLDLIHAQYLKVAKARANGGTPRK